jgi:hypothetical protein
MTPDEFRALGQLAWGAAWQRPMAAALGVSRHAVQSMALGRLGIREDHAPKLRAALLEQAGHLREAAKALPR